MAESEDRSYAWALDDPGGYANTMGDYKTQREWDFMARFLEADAQRVLDIGGGAGRFALRLAENGHTVTVVDTSVTALDLLGERVGDLPVRLLPGDFMGLAMDDEPVDAALAIESILYLTEVPLQEVFARVASQLQPGGRFVCTVLNSRSWRPWVRHTLGRARRDQFRSATPEQVRVDLHQAGFDLLAMEGFMWIPFSVTSDSSLVPGAAKLEKRLGLERRVTFAPWLLVAAERR